MQFSVSTNASRSALVSALLAGGALVSACSDGGESANVVQQTPPPPTTSTPPPATVSGPTFTAGVFEARTEFEQRCENPRSGVDIEGNSFPDLPGSLLEELFWLRSWTHETYLFNDEVVDQDPNLFDDRLYFRPMA